MQPSASGKLSQRVFDLTTNKIQFINLPFNNLTIETNLVVKQLIIRDYQQDAYNQLLNKKSSILSLPCGMGQSCLLNLESKAF